MSGGVIEGFRLSHQQARIWRLSHGGARARYRARCAALLEGALDVTRLKQALQAVVDRHEMLRTTFASVPGVDLPLQVVAERGTFEWSAVDATHQSEDQGQALVEEVLASQAERPFDFGRGPLVRAAIVVLSPARAVLALSVAPIAADARTLETLVREICAAYGAAAPGSADGGAEPVQYVQFSEWQNDAVQNEAGHDEPRLPDDEQLNALDEDCVVVPVALTPEVSRTIDGIAARQGIATPVFLLACWQVVLSRFANEDAIAIATLSDGRDFDELSNVIGLFETYRTRQLRIASGLRFEELLRHVDEVVRSSETDRARPQVAFEFRSRTDCIDIGGLRASIQKLDVRIEEYALTLACARTNDTLEIALRVASSRIGPSRIAALAEEVATLIAAAAANPECRVQDLPIVGPREHERLTRSLNRTDAPRDTRDVLDRFEAAAARHPERVAVEAVGRLLTYRELDRRGNQLAHRLRELGVGPEQCVALLQTRSVSTIVAILGIWKAGGAYVPLDTGWPDARIAQVLDQSGARILITQRDLPARCPDWNGRVVCIDQDEVTARPADRVPRSSAPGRLAYAIYTSGSTGQPKGVTIEHRSLANLATALDARIHATLGETLRVSVNAPLVFDASVKQLIQLASGHTLVVTPEDERHTGEGLRAWIEAESIDVLDGTPSQLRMVEECGGLPPDLQAVLIGGEALDARLWNELAHRTRARCYNVYGPTECTVDATVCRIAGTQPRIGTPLPNVQTYIADAAMHLVPAGAVGELVIGGDGVGRGYTRQPALTAERFVPDPFGTRAGARLYRTGDLVRWNDADQLEYVGRTDHQVKIRGHRLELGEVESVLVSCPGVREAIVMAREDVPGDTRLVAYVVPEHETRSRHRLPNGLAVLHQNRNETDYLYSEIFEKRTYLRHGVRLKDGAVVVDVGANIGMFSMFVASQCRDARVYAFEPVGPIFDSLRANLDAYVPNARLFQYGLASGERREHFTYYPRYSMMSGLSAYADAAGEIEVVKRYLRNEAPSAPARAAALLAEADDLLAGRFEGEAHELRVRCLSDVMREEGVEHIDLLKVDVQRAEFDVLLGIRDEDWGRIDQVVMEVHDAHGGATEGRLAAITSLLAAHGLHAVVEQDPLLEGTDRHNLYAVRPELASVAWRATVTSTPADPPAEPTLSAEALRRQLGDRLPEYMVPSAYVWLPQLPLTRNGKVDRAALPAPDGRAAHDHIIAPRTMTEDVLAGLWADVLRLERVSVDASFFDLGGHSLLATQLISRVRQTFAIELPLRALFAKPTVAELALEIEEAQRNGQGLVSPPIARSPHAAPRPLSFTQERLWFLYKLEPGNPVYNCPSAVRLSGALDVAALSRAFNEMTRRHEVLRTTFQTIDGVPAQVVQPPDPVSLPLIDLRHLQAEAREAEARRIVDAEAREPFDLTKRAPIRARLLRLDAHVHILVCVVHHIAADGWSIGVMVREIEALYGAFARRRPSPLPAPEVQYGDYAVWQRGWLDGDMLDRQLAYWRQQLAGAPRFLALPADFARPAVPTYRGGRVSRILNAEICTALRALSRREGVTLFMTLVAALNALLARYSGQDDIAIGTPIAGRTRREIEGLIGCFVNTLVLRTSLSANPTFRELLAQVREVALGAYAHQDLPFEKLVEALQPSRDMGRSPLFQVMALLQNVPDERFDAAGLNLEPMRVDTGRTKLDLTVMMKEVGDVLVIDIEYSEDLFEAASAVRMLDHFVTLLTSAAANPSCRVASLPLLTPLELTTVVEEWGRGPAAAIAAPCVTDLFEAQVRRTPTAVAVTCAGESLTYRELDARANALACELQRRGVCVEERVGVCLDRSVDLMIALLGIWKAGASYVPLEPGLPAARRAFMRADAAARLVVTNARWHADAAACGGDVLELASLPDPVVAAPHHGARSVSLTVERYVGPAVPLHAFQSRGPQDGEPLDSVEPMARLVVTNPTWRTGAAACGGDVLELASLPDPVVAAPHHGARSASLPLERHAGPAVPFRAFRSRGRQEGETPFDSVESMARLAYVLYTSGSTGAPKGVMVPHGAVVNYLTWSAAAYAGPRADSIVHTSVGFDLTVTSLFVPLLRGGTVVLVPAGEDIEGFARVVSEAPGIGLVKLTPSHLPLLAPRAGGAAWGDRTIVLGGEAVRGEQLREWQAAAPGLRVINEYGPTEATVGCCVYDVPSPAPSGAVPIGRPIAETCLYVLDAWGQPAPIGVAGELYIGGAGLARGYVGQPAGTAARFVPDAWSGIAGARVYRTGDRARWRADGQLEFLGRADHQVKVRGYRIELGEVEAALEQCDSVRAAVVVAQRVPTTGDRAASDNATGDRATGDGALRLVAYVVTDGRPVAAVREQLATLLPAYMIPSAIIPLERLPLTANGKVDHAALPSASGETHLEDYEAPRTPDEERVARVWADVLSLERVSIQDDFFALGGHSLLADRLIARLRRDFDIELPLRSIFERPTIAALTEAIVAAKAAGACHDAPAVVPIARAARRVSLAAIRDI